METTSITAAALGRKVGASAEDVRSWASGSADPPARAVELLEKFRREILANVVLDGPRQGASTLTSRVVCGDCREVLTTLPDHSVDLIVSDIPYGIGLDEWDVMHANRNAGYLGASEAQRAAGAVFKKRHKPINGWSAEDRSRGAQYYAWCRSWSSEWLRVLRPGGSAFVFAGRRYAHRAATALEDEGFNLRDSLAWLRPKAVYRAQRLSVVYRKRGLLAEAKRWDGWRVGNLRPVFEPILWCSKPYATTIADNMLDYHLGGFNGEAVSDFAGAPENVLRFGLEPSEGKHHEAQKPVALLRALIEMTTTPDQVVLDPFAGSGSTVVAAKASGRRYLAVEIDPAMVGVMQQRLAALDGA